MEDTVKLKENVKEEETGKEKEKGKRSYLGEGARESGRQREREVDKSVKT